jgi:anti-sigma factor ChrR (cupin superfamily)
MSKLLDREVRVKPVGLPSTGSLNLDASRIDWQDCGDGFLSKALLEDERAGLRTELMKVEAGAFSPLHAHPDIEQIYVLDGSFFDQDKSYFPGEFIVRAPGAMHSAGSEQGALLLLVYSPASDS